jgi:hypothetical protein
MISPKPLLAALQKRVTLLEDDLRERCLALPAVDAPLKGNSLAPIFPSELRRTDFLSTAGVDVVCLWGDCDKGRPGRGPCLW